MHVSGAAGCCERDERAKRASKSIPTRAERIDRRHILELSVVGGAKHGHQA